MAGSWKHEDDWADKAGEEGDEQAFDHPPTPEDLEADQDAEATESIRTSAPYRCSRGKDPFLHTFAETKEWIAKSKQVTWDSCSISGTGGPPERINATVPNPFRGQLRPLALPWHSTPTPFVRPSERSAAERQNMNRRHLHGSEDFSR